MDIREYDEFERELRIQMRATLKLADKLERSQRNGGTPLNERTALEHIQDAARRLQDALAVW